MVLQVWVAVDFQAAVVALQDSVDDMAHNGNQAK